MSTDQYEELLAEVRKLRERENVQRANKWQIVNNVLSGIILALTLYFTDTINDHSKSIDKLTQQYEQHENDYDWTIGNIQYNFNVLNDKKLPLVPVYKQSNRGGTNTNTNNMSK